MHMDWDDIKLKENASSRATAEAELSGLVGFARTSSFRQQCKLRLGYMYILINGNFEFVSKQSLNLFILFT